MKEAELSMSLVLSRGTGQSHGVSCVERQGSQALAQALPKNQRLLWGAGTGQDAPEGHASLVSRLVRCPACLVCFPVWETAKASHREMWE